MSIVQYKQTTEGMGIGPKENETRDSQLINADLRVNKTQVPTTG